MGARVYSFIHTPRPDDMSYAEWALMIHIIERYDDFKHCAWFRKSYAVEKMKASAGYVKKLIGDLEEKGYLRVYARVKRHNRYVVPRLEGEILPADIVIHEGPTLIDPDSGLVWKLRNPGAKFNAVPDPPYIDPAALVDVAAMAAEDAALAAAEDAFTAAVAVDPEMARNDEKRRWYDFLVSLQGAPPMGKKAGEWDTIINHCMGKGIAMDDFAACYAAAQKKWDAKAVVNPTSVYNNWDSLFPIVKAERTVSRKREAAAARAMADEKPAPLTDAERAHADAIRAEFAERSKKKREMTAWRMKNHIWTEGHPADHLNCAECVANKRQWERQRTVKSATVTG